MTDNETVPLLAAEHLYHAHDQGTGWILEDVGLQLRAGELVHLKGDNGSGKSTLLRLLAGHRLPVRGRVLVMGRELGAGVGDGRQHVALVSDSLTPSPWLGAEEYLELRATWCGVPPEGRRDRVEAGLEAFDLKRLRDRPIANLSFGERRRVVLAAALLSPAEVLLFDEPTNGLDRRHRTACMERLGEASRTRAVLVTTHVERDDLPGSVRTLVLEAGRLEVEAP